MSDRGKPGGREETNQGYIRIMYRWETFYEQAENNS